MDNYWEKFKTPFLCFGGYSGVGKTTLLSKLIKKFKDDGVRVGYYKHDSHRFVMDKEGKDTHKCAKAGAELIAINDPRHFAVLGDNNFKKFTITHALEQCDCILIEGYKQSPFNKIVFLDENGDMPISPETPNIKAIIHQGKISKSFNSQLPFFERGEIDSIYEFVKKHFQQSVFREQGKRQIHLSHDAAHRLEAEKALPVRKEQQKLLKIEVKVQKIEMTILRSFLHCQTQGDVFLPE